MLIAEHSSHSDPDRDCGHNSQPPHPPPHSLTAWKQKHTLAHSGRYKKQNCSWQFSCRAVNKPANFTAGNVQEKKGISFLIWKGVNQVFTIFIKQNPEQHVYDTHTTVYAFEWAAIAAHVQQLFLHLDSSCCKQTRLDEKKGSGEAERPRRCMLAELLAKWERSSEAVRDAGWQ